MRNAWRKQENVSSTDPDIAVFAVIDNFQCHVAFELVEKFLALVDVIVLSRIRSADDHDDEIGILPDYLVSNRRFQQMPMFIDPAFEI
jgi:hypothetical protein